MKANLITIVVVAVVVVVTGAGWLILPALQGSQRTVSREAAVHVERARRLLHEYDLRLAQASRIRDQLLDDGVAIDNEDLEAIADDDVTADRYQLEHENAWEAYQPMDWADQPREARAAYGNIARQLRDGLEGRDELSGRNDDLLADALDAVEEALAVTSGDVGARSHVEANRLKSMVEFYMALDDWMHACNLWYQAAPYRATLADLTAKVTSLESAQSLVADSGIDEQIRGVEKDVAELEQTLAERRSSLQQLNQTIAEMEAALASSKQRTEQTRAERDELRAAGPDFSDPNGAQAFADRYLTLDQAYRTALREVSALQVGSLPFAEIDSTGDFVAGKYTENGSTANLTQRFGVEHYYGERRAVLAEIAVGEDAIVDLRAAVERLAGLKASFQTDQDRAARQIPAARTSAAEAFDELNEIVAVAHDIEEDALQLFADAEASARQAAAGAREAMSRAQQHTQNLPPEATERSAYGKRQQDRWIGGHISAQVADTHLARAWVYLQRYYGYHQNAELLARVAEPLQLGDIDLAGERALSTEAHDAGVEEINQAMATLERAHRDAGRHWTFVAQEAGATYLMALFGHPGYVEDAVTAYRNAIRGREDDHASSPFAARLDFLESR